MGPESWLLMYAPAPGVAMGAGVRLEEGIEAISVDNARYSVSQLLIDASRSMACSLECMPTLGS